MLSLKTLALTATLFLAACSSLPMYRGHNAKLSFQNGQQLTIRLESTDQTLQASFIQWVQQGVYTQAPVYRQLPGIFILTGKPRLSGNGFVPGQLPMPLPNSQKPAEAGVGDIGLLVHSDGTVGPELILMYGKPIVTCCEAPASIRIGSITAGKSKLRHVERGDNLLSIAIQP